VRNYFHKLAMIVVLGSGFAIAQSMPSQPSSSQAPNSPQTQQPSSTDQQQPSTAPDQSQKPANAPETLPNTDQKKSDDQGVKKDQDQKLPQSDAAPAATGDVQNTIQTALQKDPTLASASITVDVKNGKAVELSGTVPSKDAKEAAERIAKENAGGLKVKNHLKVASNKMDNDKNANPKPDMSNPKSK
jgi:osmotically-inducible protein OsmY